MTNTFEQIRMAELERVRHYFEPEQNVLEIGGGSGLQASMIAAMGPRVLSVDLAQLFSGNRHFTVVEYDGRNIPAQTASCDRVFSSNVLEHVRDLPPLFAEITRVLAPSGLAIHILPTAVWRLWTNVTHYGYLAKRMVGIRHIIPSVGEGPSAGDALRKHGLLGTISRLLLAGPHGEYPNALAEMYYFSVRRWQRVFAENGFEVIRSAPTRLFYTGYGLGKGLSVDAREKLSHLLGSATWIYVTRAQGPRS